MLDMIKKSTGQRFQSVWFYKDWSDRPNQKHTGDISAYVVGKEHDGSLCAIQYQYHEQAPASSVTDDANQESIHEIPEWASDTLIISISDFTKADEEALRRIPRKQTWTIKF